MSNEHARVIERWYRVHRDAIQRYAVRRVGPNVAEEVVSEVFAAALEAHVKPCSSEVLPWLYGIARHIVAKVRYGYARQHALDEKLQGSVNADPGADVANSVVSRDWVRSVLASLDMDNAELLRLIAWEGLDTASAAKVLGIRPGTARVRLHRLRRRLQHQLSSRTLELLVDGESQ